MWTGNYHNVLPLSVFKSLCATDPRVNKISTAKKKLNVSYIFRNLHYCHLEILKGLYCRDHLFYINILILGSLTCFFTSILNDQI